MSDFYTARIDKKSFLKETTFFPQNYFKNTVISLKMPLNETGALFLTG